ncbi:40S ribosomal protein S19-1 [Vitis vinifera]|uniref:40S ribosomal protein S19-1 n=1 Tax=Vitis vinifera TaxID=29760 RepID=A0A438E308_VITVI|nr:40S ribosomal protein S19-1 [Vitis vinifera]
METAKAARTVKDVSPHEFVKAYSSHLKRSGKLLAYNEFSFPMKKYGLIGFERMEWSLAPFFMYLDMGTSSNILACVGAIHWACNSLKSSRDWSKWTFVGLGLQCSGMAQGDNKPWQKQRSLHPDFVLLLYLGADPPCAQLGQIPPEIWEKSMISSENTLDSLKFTSRSVLSPQIELPHWTDIVKTATFKELAPYDPDWYYELVASEEFMVGARGMEVAPPHFCKSSGSIARHILQQLEKMNIIENDPRGNVTIKLPYKQLISPVSPFQKKGSKLQFERIA